MSKTPKKKGDFPQHLKKYFPQHIKEKKIFPSPP